MLLSKVMWYNGKIALHYFLKDDPLTKGGQLSLYLFSLLQLNRNQMCHL
jgi:hypothetical protein